MQATRITDLPSGILALTTTARGMVNNTMVLSAQAALWRASCLAIAWPMDKASARNPMCR
jgi:hypothetical protein